MNVIYVDVLFCVNFIVNYILLLSTSSLTRAETTGIRMCLGAIVGAICSFVILLPTMGFVINFLIRVVISVLTVLPAFKIKALKGFIKISVSFLLLGFLFAGMMFAIMQFLTPAGLVVNNASVYINISPSFIIMTTLICYTVLSFCERFVAHKLPKETECAVTIKIDGKEVDLKGITDTGNSLRETFSDYPVIIVESQAIKDLFPSDVYRSIIAVGTVENYSWNKRFRLIPYNTVSGEGVLTAFRPDEIVIKSGGKEIKTKKIYVAVSERRISADFEAVLNSEIVKSM